MKKNTLKAIGVIAIAAVCCVFICFEHPWMAFFFGLFALEAIY